MQAFIVIAVGWQLGAAQSGRNVDTSALVQSRVTTKPNGNPSLWGLQMRGADMSEPVEEALELRLMQTFIQESESAQDIPAWLIVIVVILAVSLFLILSSALLLWRRRDLRRILMFFWTFGHIIRAFRKAQKQTTDKDELEQIMAELQELYAPKILEGIVEMGGMFIKIGQLASLNPDVPEVVRNHLKALHDNCKPLEAEELGNLVEAELRQTDFWLRSDLNSGEGALKQVFSRFDAKPIGVASIGQVHRARLRESSQDVVVKVQFPEARGLFEADLFCLKNAIEMVKGAHNWTFTAVCEVEQQLAQEFDYRQEAANVDTMRAVLLPKFSDTVVLPDVRHDLSTDTMITMSFIEGQRLDRALGKKLEDAGLGEVAKVLKLSSGDEEASPELLVGGDDVTVGDDDKAEPREGDACSGAQVHNQREVLAAADCQQVVQTMFDVWGYCVVKAGAFNADPHPGNILLMPDGRLGLVDFGQVKSLGLPVRKALAATILALLRADVAGTAKAIREVGVSSKLEDGDTRLWYHAGQVFERRSFLPNLDEAWGKQGGHAGDMVFIVRALSLLRGVALGLGFPMSSLESWGKWAAATPAEQEEVEKLVQEIKTTSFSGSYALSLDIEGHEKASAGTMTLQHAPGSHWFVGTCSFIDGFGRKREGPIHAGFLCGRSIEFKAENFIVRGIVRNNGESISNIRATDVETLDVFRCTATRTSGSMGRAFNTMKAKAVAAIYHFKLKQAAKASKNAHSLAKQAQDQEQAPEATN